MKDTAPLRIIVQTDSLAMIDSTSDLITGEIFFTFGDSSLPAHAWTDFPIVILGWWASAVTGLNRTRSEKLLFMDGPYWLELERTEPSGFLAVWVDDHIPQQRRPLGRIELGAIHAELIHSVDSVLSECSRRRWDTRDVRSLRAARETLVRSTS